MDKDFTLGNSPTNRDDWEFEYKANYVLAGAEKQAEFRKERLKVWTEKKKEVMNKIRESGLEIHEGVADQLASYSNTATRGYGPQVMIDPMMQRDLNECVGKISTHETALKGYESWIQVLGANPDATLKLKHQDWMYFFGK